MHKFYLASLELMLTRIIDEYCIKMAFKKEKPKLLGRDLDAPY